MKKDNAETRSAQRNRGEGEFETSAKDERTARKSELEFQVELSAPWGIGGDGLSEEWRSDHADVGYVTGMVENIERIQGDGEGGDVFLFIGFRFAAEVVR